MPKPLSPESRAKISQARRAWLADPANRQRIRAKQLSNQAKIKVNAILAEERIAQLVQAETETPSEKLTPVVAVVVPSI